MKTYKILIVEDEWINAQFLSKVLKKLNQIVVSIVSSSDEALVTVKNNQIDLVFMDIKIDGAIDGISCAEIINQEYEIPIIYTTAFSDKKTLENASKTNIYGFLIKPYDAKDVESILYVIAPRMKDSISKSIIKKEYTDFGNGYIYYIESRIFRIDEIEIHFTKKETQLMHFFCENIDQTLSYDMLKKYVWPEKNIENSTVREIILRLRKKAPLLPLTTLSGIGYCLKKIY